MKSFNNYQKYIIFYRETHYNLINKKQNVWFAFIYEDYLIYL